MSSHRSPVRIADTATAQRAIGHRHFAPGDRVAVVTGSTDGDLQSQTLTVVASSRHLPTGQDGWRVRHDHGGEHSFLTAHPRHLIHIEQHCPPCTAFLRAVAEELLPQLPPTGTVRGAWYRVTPLDQLVHAHDHHAPR